MITRRQFLNALALSGLAVSSSCRTASARPARPNIILMLCDDLGWRDPSCFGNDRLATPNIDRLARGGIRLTRFYSASAVCTPTRASILTGRYPLRFDIRQHFVDSGEFLPACTTLPKLLKQAGYGTVHIGKWHLGGLRGVDLARRDRVPGPHEHGFDHYLCQQEDRGLRTQLAGQKLLYRKGGTCLLRDDRKVGADDPYFNMYLTDVYGEEAVRQVRKLHGEGQPFFVNLWWFAPHQPYEPAPEPEWTRTAAEGISEDQHRYRSMVARVDYQVGRILDTLDELGIADDTLVVFLSDNGGAYEANIGQLKGGKTDLHEGGIRVPFLARWPGRIKANSECSQLGHTNDLLPTICSAAGVSLADGLALDGMDISPLLTGRPQARRRGTVFWQVDPYRTLQRHYPRPQPYAKEAARNGRWKMLAADGTPLELFDVESDVGEEHNLLAEQPEQAAALATALKAWLAEPRQPFGQADSLPAVRRGL